MVRSFSSQLLAVLALGVSVAAGEPLSFEKDIRPILKTNCFHCHGDEKELKGGVDLRFRKQIVAGGESGPVIALGDHAKSLLFDLIQSGDMPPQEEKRLKPAEVALIARWIDEGATVTWAEPEIIPEPGAYVINPVEKQHWAFQPIANPEPPRNGAASAVDAFLQEKLAEHKLTFSPEADKLTLIRRASHDLLGLPPSPEQLTRFLADKSPDAYERMIDELLQSPHYGERWARHWLDVAGYADSEGYNDKDVVREDAWRYRDYVIRALNEDKPWDQFITEQLAGDELAKAVHASAQGLANRDPKALDLLTATGFLRMAPDGTGSAPMDPALSQNQVITETVKVVSSALLGVTVGCAECHNHRFDPIPQEDFYRMRAIFAPVYDTGKWRMPNARRAAIQSEEDAAKSAEIEARARVVDAAYVKARDEVVQIVFERELATIPAELRDFARTAYNTPAAKRTPEQTSLIHEKYPMLNVFAGALGLFLNKYKDEKELTKRFEDPMNEAAAIRKEKPLPDFIRVATEDPTHVPATYIFYRGDYTSPETKPISPGDFTVLSDLQPNTFAEDDPALPTSGRRLAYARHLTNGKHPLVARVLVNRFWQGHFGRGLVSTPDFGTRGQAPSHPELLDWLAHDFMSHGWTLKRLHKLIMTSQAYRQTSQRRPEAEGIDPENHLVWRMPVRRLDAEELRDSILAVSGQLNPQPYGAPIPVALNEGGIFAVAGDLVSADARELKRSIYVQMRRTQPVAMLEAFDAPQMEPNCEQRIYSTVAPQSLALMNGEFVLAQAKAFANRVWKDGAAPESMVNEVWTAAFGGEVPVENRAALIAYLAAQTQEFEKSKQKEPGKMALASLCQVLLGSNPFLYVD